MLGALRGLGFLAMMMAAVASPERPPLRREARLSFSVDAPLQDAGGVQYFYELVDREDVDRHPSEALTRLLPLETGGRWERPDGARYAVLLRVSYALDKDVGFFSPERVRDPAFMNAILPGGEISRLGPDTFRAGKTPSNTFTVQHLSGAYPPPGAAHLLQLQPELGLPDSVVVQRNQDFARVMGFRTGDVSVTYTAHYRLGPGRTRVVVYTLSLLHNLPPFFLGGRARVHDEALSGALMLIQNLRRFPG